MQWSEQIVPLASLAVAFATVLVTALLMWRQVRAMEHERDALALLEAIDRLSSPHLVAAFETLRDAEKRYPTAQIFAERFPKSDDERAAYGITQYMETVATLARRGVLSASLLADAMGLLIRTRWQQMEPFTRLRRQYQDNPYIFENFEWLARYSDWWKDVPRPPGDPNYWPDQFERGKAKP